MAPYTAFNFLVEIRSLVVGRFSEVSGLQAETETEDYQEGGRNDFVHKLPKVTKYPNLVLKRGITDSTDLWQWHQNVITGRIQRQNGSVILLDYTGSEKWRWNFTNAYPVKWVGPELKGDSNTVAVETLELSHNGLSKA
ncbi:MAG: phage tail protein [Pseudanabaenales cyanobacterium]|nr:phage tail protein [Pseudanabaenales cyanobacterium]